MSEKSAIWGMFLGFSGCVVTKSYSAIQCITLPVYLDPFFIGIVLSVIGMALGSRTGATDSDAARFDSLHIKPESEKVAAEIKKTHSLMWLYMIFAISLGVFFVFAYAKPYLSAIS